MDRVQHRGGQVERYRGKPAVNWMLLRKPRMNKVSDYPIPWGFPTETSYGMSGISSAMCLVYRPVFRLVPRVAYGIPQSIIPQDYRKSARARDVSRWKSEQLQHAAASLANLNRHFFEASTFKVRRQRL